MKKTTKTKSKAKAKNKPKAKAKPKTKTKIKAKSKKTVKKTAKKKKTISVIELFQLKKAKQNQNVTTVKTDKKIPPHELHDKANLQAKPEGNTKIGRSPTTRHH